MSSTDRVCASCGARNRIPPRHLASVGRCGSCRAALPPRGAPIDTDPETFRGIVQSARVPVLVDFWAAWCGPCRMAAPAVEQVAKAAAGRALVLKVDTEAHPSLAAAYGVQAIPNFLVLHEGRVVQQHAGVVPAGEMLRWIGVS